ncbi:Calcium-binding component of the spindle pole body (SPB) half-bridge [Tieghemiomyces parasiticus]|uniref:Calcium-binding component of the spindle pole body (SPB) half-bridge n=1 Tax=Tieghemiomyces parasiticus TaxID=78921 RepID=A0A9W8AGY6_9FUNG|nr:Calcium-binding component of the spindle pole body (SPB) half-bridge [Tieghemiomyces parasiticus]
MKALGFEVPKSEVLQLLKQYSRGDSQRVTQSDFITIMTEKIRQRDPMDEIHKAFKLFDENGNGRITVGDLRRVAQELGESPNDEELQAMIDEFDMDNDGASK